MSNISTPSNTSDHTITHPAVDRARRLVVALLVAVLAALGLVIAPSGHAGAQAAASIGASPDPAPAGSTVTVSGSGYLPGETVTIGYGGAGITTTADANGNVSAPMTIDPMMPAGSHPLDASGDMGSWADSSLGVQAPAPPPTAPPTTAPAPPPAAPVVPASISASPDPVVAGGSTTVSGSGFQPGESVTIGYAGDQTSGTVAADGTFAVTISVAANVPAMAHPLDANGSSGTSVTISLTTTAPAPPITTGPAPAPPAPPTTSAPAPVTPPAPAPAPTTPPATQPPAPAPTPAPSTPAPAPRAQPQPTTAPEEPATTEVVQDDAEVETESLEDDTPSDVEETSVDQNEVEPVDTATQNGEDDEAVAEIVDARGAFDEDQTSGDDDLAEFAAAPESATPSNGVDRNPVVIALFALAAGLLAAALGLTVGTLRQRGSAVEA